ncbi:MAG: c-type cytochrome [Chloroflexi bacterium]|nr:c-type cytochrome [Chloroflexota bacterium]
MRRLVDWIDERTGIRNLLRGFLYRPVPRGVGWWYIFGSATMLTALIQGITGIFLTLYYVPSVDQAYESVEYISNEVLFGSFIRGLHHWSASALIVLVVLHLLRVLFFGAYKYPREANWLIGVGLLLVALALALTGYLLPWNQVSYWGTTVVTEIMGTIPVVGPALLRLARGGTEVGAVTLTRFFSLHVMFLPLAGVLLFAPHLYLVVRQGISNPPERKVPVPADPEGYQAFYGERKKGGHTFYPHVIFKDSLAFLVVFAVLAALAIFVGVKPEPKADPTATDFVPRPEWYFLFLFQFLRLLKPQWEIIGTLVFPLGGVLLLFLLPFLDRNRYRHPLDRPVITAVAALAFVGIVALTVQGALAPSPEPSQVTRLEITRLTPIQEEGRRIYKESACAVCHAIDGVGGTRGPDLAGVGTRLDPESLIRHLRPSPGSSLMPAYSLDNRDLIALTSYLLALTTPPKAGAPSPTPISSGQARYQAQGCPACHAIDGMGGVTGPDLSGVGARRDRAWLVQYLQDPTVVLPNSQMPVHSLAPEDVQAIADYLSGLTGGALAGGPSAEAGKVVYEDQGCSVCHAIQGRGGTLGPDLTRIGQTRDAAYLKQYVKDPKSLNANATMPPYGKLTEVELESLALYMLSVSGKAPAPVPTATGFSGPAHTRTPTAAPAQPATPDGAALYARLCAACHGDKGQGGPVAKEAINTPGLLRSRSDEQLAEIIRAGKEGMPGFGSTLSAEEINAIVRFMRTWLQ